MKTGVSTSFIICLLMASSDTNPRNLKLVKISLKCYEEVVLIELLDTINIKYNFRNDFFRN